MGSWAAKHTDSRQNNHKNNYLWSASQLRQPFLTSIISQEAGDSLCGRPPVPAEQMVQPEAPRSLTPVSGVAELGLQSLTLLALSRGPAVFLSAWVHAS